jgi:polysaccharide pyruvyl transferase WcaK-like protein
MMSCDGGNEGGHRLIRVLIAEDIPGENKGEAALFWGIRESLRALGPIELSILSVNHEQDRNHYGDAANVVDASGVTPKHIVSGLGTSVAKAFNYSVFLGKHAVFLAGHAVMGSGVRHLCRSDVWQAYLAADLVILGHDSFWAPLYHGPLLAFFRGLGKPTMVFGGTIAPPFAGSNRIKSWIAGALTRGGLRRAGVVTLRETYSERFVRSLGVTGHAPAVEVHADLAVLLEPLGREPSAALLAAEGVVGDGPLIGMAVSDRTLGYAFPGVPATERKELAVAALARLADHAIERTGGRIVFLPHCTGPTPSLDDRMVADRIIGKASFSDRMFNLRGQYTSVQLKGMAGLLDATMGTRLHFTVDALCNGVPSLLLTHGSDIRCHGIAGDTFRQNEFVLNIEGEDNASLCTHFNRLWDRREEVRCTLQSVLPSVKASARRHGELARDLLRARGVSVPGA